MIVTVSNDAAVTTTKTAATAPATETATATETETAATETEAATDAVTETATDEGRTTESSDTEGSTGDASDGSGSDQPTTDETGTKRSTAAGSADTGGDGPRSAVLSVTNATLNRTQVPIGGVVAVNATVRNAGNATATRPVRLTVAGEPAASRNVTVRAGESRTVRFLYRTNETGEYPVAVGFASAGTLTVGESGGGLVPWGLLKTVAMYVAGVLVAVYAVLKALAIYLGY